MVAEARRLEQQRRLATAEHKLDTLADRLAALEPPPERAVAEPHAADTTMPADPNRTALGPGDIEWIVDGWREHDWQ